MMFPACAAILIFALVLSQKIEQHVQTEEVSSGNAGNNVELFELTLEGNEDSLFLYDTVDIKPLFQGKDAGTFASWVAARMSTSSAAQSSAVGNKIALTFVVTSEGVVEKIEMLKPIDPALAKEIFSIMLSSSKWTPAELNGERVNVSCTMQLDFGAWGE